MSIIERTLNKLENTQPILPGHMVPDPYELRAARSSASYRKTIRLFVAAFSILSLTAIFIVQQSTTQERPTANSASTGLLEIKRNVISAAETSPIITPETKPTEEPEILETITLEATPSKVKDLEWVNTGWNWFENVSLREAVKQWESGFEELNSNDGVYIAEVMHYTESTALSRVEAIKDPSLFFVRWPLKIGNQLVGLCLQPASNIGLDKNHCSHKLSRTKPLVLKADLAMALLVENMAKKNTPEVKKNNVASRVVAKTQTVQATPKPVEKPAEPKMVSQPKPMDVENIIPRQLQLHNYQSVLDVLYENRLKLADAWEYYYWQSQAYIGLGQFENAEKSLNVGLNKNPLNALLLTQKGLMQQEKGDHEAALTLFRKAELMKNKPASLYLNMGYSAAVLGDFLVARRAYYQFLSMTENSTEYDQSIRQQVVDYLNQIQ